MSPRKKVISLAEKIRIINEKESSKVSQKNLAKQFGYSENFIKVLLKNKDDIKKEWLDKQAKLNELSELLKEDIECYNDNQKLDILSKANEVAKMLKIKDFNALNWLQTEVNANLENTFCNLENEPIIEINSQEGPEPLKKEIAIFSENGHSLNNINSYTDAIHSLQNVEQFLFLRSNEELSKELHGIIEKLKLCKNLQPKKQSHLTDFWTKKAKLESSLIS